jgi:hypothetical protein
MVNSVWSWAYQAALNVPRKKLEATINAVI